MKIRKFSSCCWQQNQLLQTAIHWEGKWTFFIVCSWLQNHNHLWFTQNANKKIQWLLLVVKSPDAVNENTDEKIVCFAGSKITAISSLIIQMAVLGCKISTIVHREPNNKMQWLLLVIKTIKSSLRMRTNYWLLLVAKSRNAVVLLSSPLIRAV